VRQLAVFQSQPVSRLRYTQLGVLNTKVVAGHTPTRLCVSGMGCGLVRLTCMHVTQGSSGPPSAATLSPPAPPLRPGLRRCDSCSTSPKNTTMGRARSSSAAASGPCGCAHRPCVCERGRGRGRGRGRERERDRQRVWQRERPSRVQPRQVSHWV
jgi:hypothetical protein